MVTILKTPPPAKISEESQSFGLWKKPLKVFALVQLLLSSDKAPQVPAHQPGLLHQPCQLYGCHFILLFLDGGDDDWLRFVGFLYAFVVLEQLQHGPEVDALLLRCYLVM